MMNSMESNVNCRQKGREREGDRESLQVEQIKKREIQTK